MTSSQLAKLIFKRNKPVTQLFGKRPWAYLKYGMRGHNGIDFGVVNGTKVRAVADGCVTWAKSNGSYGIEVRLTHGGGGQTNYAHLKKALVSQGTRVYKGTIIGLSDNTGNSTGPHLHFGYRKPHWNNNNGYKGWVDPLKHLKV